MCKSCRNAEDLAFKQDKKLPKVIAEWRCWNGS
jgi:hypothetical protein